MFLIHKLFTRNVQRFLIVYLSFCLFKQTVWKLRSPSLPSIESNLYRINTRIFELFRATILNNAMLFEQLKSNLFEKTLYQIYRTKL